MQNINSNNVKGLKLLLTNNEYFDFMLYKGDNVDNGTLEDKQECLACVIDRDSFFDGTKVISSIC